MQSKLPLLRKISKFDFTKKVWTGITDIIMNYVEAHQKTLNPENAKDFLDVMLIETKTSSNPESCFSPKLGIPTIVSLMIDLFMAGMETTSSSLLFVFLHMLHHPEVQKKVHQEIDLVRSIFDGVCLYLSDFKPLIKFRQVLLTIS